MHVHALASVDRARREDGGHHGAQALPRPRRHDVLRHRIGHLDDAGGLPSEIILLLFSFGLRTEREDSDELVVRWVKEPKRKSKRSSMIRLWAFY